MRSERGVSLIEATVILGVVSMLTAVLAPSVRNYVTTAQQTAAQRDVQLIGGALAQMLADVGESWFLRVGHATVFSTNLDDPPDDRTSANLVSMMVSAGNIPALYASAARDDSGTTEWTDAIDDAAVQQLDNYLALNAPSDDTANAYRDATQMDLTAQFDPDSGQQFNSEHAWRGAYLPGPIGADPWGNRYAVNVEFLFREPSQDPWAPTGNIYDVFVLSAGSNGLIETKFNSDGVTAANDVIYVFGGGTR